MLFIVNFSEKGILFTKTISCPNERENPVHPFIEGNWKWGICSNFSYPLKICATPLEK
jgi:hypothetical protein